LLLDLHFILTARAQDASPQHLIAGEVTRMFESLHATTAALREFLQTLIDADPFFGAAANPWTNRAMRIQLQTPEEVTRDNGQGGLSLWIAMRSGSTIAARIPAHTLTSFQEHSTSSRTPYAGMFFSPIREPRPEAREMYQHPGVYIEKIPSGVQPIEAVSTSTALIIGYATKGPVNAPTLLFSFDQYVTQFGGIADFAGSPAGLTVDYMGHTVRAFFAGDNAAVAARIPQRTNCGGGWLWLAGIVCRAEAWTLPCSGSGVAVGLAAERPIEAYLQ
jgi:hypothetical protein